MAETPIQPRGSSYSLRATQSPVAIDEINPPKAEDPSKKPATYHILKESDPAANLPIEGVRSSTARSASGASHVDVIKR